MKAKFNHALLIAGHSFGLSEDGKPQVHEVPEKVSSHAHFKKYQDIKWIVDADDFGVVPLESLEERNKRLAEKLAASPSVVAGLDVEEESKKQPKSKKR